MESEAGVESSEGGIGCGIGNVRPSDRYEPDRLWVSVLFRPVAPRSYDLNETSGSLDEGLAAIKSGCLSCRDGAIRRIRAPYSPVRRQGAGASVRATVLSDRWHRSV